MRLSIILSLVLFPICWACNPSISENRTPIVEITDFSFPGITIRAMEVLNDSSVWFAASKGVFGYTTDNGNNWVTDTLKINNAIPEFRSIKITPNGNIFLVSISQPAAILKSKDNGKNWRVVYSDTSASAFFDAVNFWNDDTGILLGDAENGCFHFATTNDHGETWNKISCDSIPKAQLNENPFAASNTNISMNNSSVWIPMGGKSPSRIYYSNNYGHLWKTASTPIIWGETMTRIFSVDFLNDSLGIVAGGNWKDVEFDCNNLAITYNGGQSWDTLMNTNNSGYISCVQWLPETNGEQLITLSGRGKEGKSKLALYNFKWNEWSVYPNPKNYLSIQCSSKNVAWASGKNWIGQLKITY